MLVNVSFSREEKEKKEKLGQIDIVTKNRLVCGELPSEQIYAW